MLKTISLPNGQWCFLVSDKLEWTLFLFTYTSTDSSHYTNSQGFWVSLLGSCYPRVVWLPHFHVFVVFFHVFEQIFTTSTYRSLCWCIKEYQIYPLALCLQISELWSSYFTWYIPIVDCHTSTLVSVFTYTVKVCFALLMKNLFL